MSSSLWEIEGIVWPKPRPEGAPDLPETANVWLSSHLTCSGAEYYDTAFQKASDDIDEIWVLSETKPEKAMGQIAKRVPFLAESLKAAADNYDFEEMGEDDWESFFDEVFEDWEAVYEQEIGVSEDAWDRLEEDWKDAIKEALEREFGERPVSFKDRRQLPETS